MVLRELFVRIGLTPDSASFAEGFATVELLKKGLEVVAEKASEAKEWLQEQVRATVEAGLEAKRASQSLGLQADQFQRLTYAAGASEVSVENLEEGLRHMSRSGVRDVQGHLLQLADQMSKMPDDGRKVALAMQFFGREGGSRMIPLLNKGRAGITALMHEADQLGYVMGEDGVHASEEYYAAQFRLSGALQGFRNTVIRPLIGPLARFFLLLQRGVLVAREWYQRHLPALGAAAKALGVFIGSLAAVLLAQAAAAALDGASLGWLAVALLAASRSAFEAAAGFIAAAAPILGMAALVAGAVLALQDLYAFIEGGDSLIGRALRRWIGPFRDWREAVKKVVEQVKHDVANAIFGTPEENGMPVTPYVPPSGPQVNQRSRLQNWMHSMFGEAPQGIPRTAGVAMGGGATSPAAAASSARASASAGRTRVQVNNLRPSFVVHAAPGMDEKRLAAQVVRKLDEWHDGKMREAASHTG